MATLSKDNVVSAFTRLGELAVAHNQSVELLLLGGGVMVLEFNARNATRDLDVVILKPANASMVRDIAGIVAGEKSWPVDWLNDAAKGFLVGPAMGPILFQAPGIIVRRPTIEQLLAMKLCAWRDDVDIADACRLMKELSGSHDEIWQRIKGFLQPGRELKAQFAFDDLWENQHG